ncbi:MAG: BACON domain-containing protein, partial [Bacteroidales bacterium]|nr:BACON domain-containing protein [Bacteroidales bacterium]
MTPQEIVIDADAGRAEFVVEASDDWNLSGVPDWCGFVRPSNGAAGTTTVSVGGKFYDGEEARTATLTVTCGGKSIPVTLTQLGKKYILLTPDKVGPLSCDGDSFEVRVEANFTYEVEIRQEGNIWLSQTGTQPDESGMLYFVASSNSGVARTAVIVFHDTQSDYDAELAVTQFGNPYQQDRAALEELYRTAGGSSWTR